MKRYILPLILFVISLYLIPLQLLSNTTSTGVLFGKVTNAINNQPISNARVTIGDLQVQTDLQGNYRFNAIEEGLVQLAMSADRTSGPASLTVNFTANLTENTHTITVEAEGYSMYHSDRVIVLTGIENRFDVALSPVLTNAELRFVLSWGATPRDLDAHMRTPGGTLVYYGARGSSTNSPFVTLDVDVVNGYGPETTTIYRFENGTYHYYIYNYSGSPDITTSNAVVRMYNRTGILHTLNVPLTGTGRYWYVATIDGGTGAITIVNRIQTTMPGVSKEIPDTPPKNLLSSDWTYNWDFGNGNTATGSQVTGVYSQPGLYSVTLTAVRDGQSFSVTEQGYIVVTGGGTAVLRGKVTNAINNQGIAGAIVRIADQSVTTDSQGNYVFQSVPVSTVQVQIGADTLRGRPPLPVQFTSTIRFGFHAISAESDDFVTYRYGSLSILQGQENIHDISMSPNLTNAELRFVLNWGSTPADLDAHLFTPDGYRVYFGSRGSATSAPFATLDVDIMNGYGPETTTIVRFTNGTYHYFIHNYSGNPSITTSSGIVRIYNQNGIIHTIEVPTSGDGRYWYVAKVDGATGRVDIVNRVQTSEPDRSAAKESNYVSFKSNDAILSGWTYEWEFGDGSRAYSANPMHIYQQIGLYSVSVTARNGDVVIESEQDNMIEVLDATSIEIDSPMSFRLFGNYPNPFNPGSTIRYEIPESGEVSIRIYSITGSLIEDRNLGLHNSGFYSTYIGTTQWASGLYLYEIRFRDMSLTGKMMLIK